MSEEIVIQANPTPSLVNTTHLIYALHALSLLIGITTAATIIGAFVFGLPSIIAVIINYLKREEVRGTFLESHFRWQIRTFWFGAPLVSDRQFYVHNFHWHSDCAYDFRRRRRVGHLPDHSRLAGAARSKTDVPQHLITDRPLSLNRIADRSSVGLIANSKVCPEPCQRSKIQNTSL